MPYHHVLINPFASGIQKVLLSHIAGLFSVKIRKKILAIKNFSVNDTMFSLKTQHNMLKLDAHRVSIVII